MHASATGPPYSSVSEKVYIYVLLKVGPDDATLLLGTRDSVPMEHCSTLFQGVASASNSVG